MADTDDDSAPPGTAPTAAIPAVPDPVAVLVAAGDHVAAARLAVARGELARAISLYERAWRFADALPLALQLGNRPLAIKLALDAGDTVAALRVTEEIPRDAVDDLRAAAATFAARGDTWEAARISERAGDMALAAGYFRRAGSLIDLGRMEEASGRHHHAGLAYEQALAGAANDDESAAANLALGRLLARLGRHQDAARSLQQAMRVPAFLQPAGRALTVELGALGFPIAAADIVARLRREAPDLPASAEQIAALNAVDVAASTSTVGQLGAEPGLLRSRFKIQRALGAGATSQVYLAEDTLMGHPVALKLLSVGTGARGAERQAYLRFAREAEAAGRLRHPNIVALHDADPAMGLFVLELMPGGTLTDALADKVALSPAAARRLALDLLSALQAAHDVGIVHRDLKPANVLFDAVGNAKLADFGAAHLVDFGQTQTGGLLGTVAYMSPEQISGGGIGPTADLYALGVTLFEALTGRLPFAGPDIVAQHLGEEPPRAGALRPGLAEAHDAVLARALRKAPSERWRSAAQMAAAIRDWPTAPVALPPDVASHESAPGSPARDAAGTEDAPDVALGHTRLGHLFRRDDPRLGRPVLIELRTEAVEGETLAALQAQAAVGGPHVQRVLALSDDGRTVTYELCEGPVVSVSGLGDDDARAVADAAHAAIAAGVTTSGRPPSIVLTPGGPVVLLVEPLSAAPSPSDHDG